MESFLWEHPKTKGSLRLWWSFQQSPTLRDWVRNTYSPDELRRLVACAATPDLVRTWENFLGERLKLAQTVAARRRFVRCLYRRYGPEIWSTCCRAVEAKLEYDQVWLELLSRLPGALQVIEPLTFEELLVHHSLRQIALECIGAQKESGLFPK
ncbi:MAG: hypothetical protein ABSG53_02425 [Thermoguttaceae bacterium]|jgi:hypothetical protein